MSSTGGTPGPGYEAKQTDTEAVTGNPGPASTGTQNLASNTDTSGTSRSTTAYVPDVNPSVTTDGKTFETDAVNGGVSGPRTDTGMTSTLDTLQPGSGGVPLADPAYRAPNLTTAPGTTIDTTRTDREAAGSVTNPVPGSYNMTGTQDTYSIGSLGSGTGATVPDAPTGVTAASGPRSVIVGWTGVADVANDPTLGYVIESNAGGTSFAPRNVTSFEVETLDPSRNYTFRVAARNKAGLGAYSTPSGAARPYNPDAEDDVLNPDGLDPANTVNPIYRPDGSIRGGTGGTNNAPVLDEVTAGAADSYTVTVTWAKPTVGVAPTGYTVTASDGTSVTVGAVLTADLVFDAGQQGEQVTVTVAATNGKGDGEVSAPSAPVTIP